MSCHIYIGSGTGALHIPYAHALHLFTDLDTAHALDTFGRIPDQREVFIPGNLFRLCPERDINDIQVIGDFLQAAVSASGTGHALIIML